MIGPKLNALIKERDAKLAIIKPNFFGGELLAILAFCDDSEYLGILNNCDGWEQFMVNNPWYPAFRGGDAAELLKKLDEHVESMPEHHRDEWITGCWELERGIVNQGWNDYCYPTHTLEGKEFPEWEYPYHISREWVGEALLKYTYDFMDLGHVFTKMSDSQKADEIENLEEDVDRLHGLLIGRQDSKDRAREIIAEYVNSR